MAIGTSGSISTACRGQLITTDVRRTRNHFTSTALSASHHTTNTGLNPSHGSCWRTRTRWRALANGLNRRGTAVLTGLLKTCVGRPGHGFTSTGFISCDALRPSCLGSTHHQVAVGDAETHFGSFGLWLRTTETIDLFGTDVLVTSDAMTRSELITGDGGRTADHRAGHACSREGFRQTNFGRWASLRQGFRPQILITGQAAIGAGLISGDVGRLADHDATDGSALLALAMTHLARGRVRTAAIGSGLVGGDVLGTGHALARTGLITRHFFRTTHFISGDPVAMGCGRDTNLGGSGGFRSGFTECLEDLSP